MRTIEFLILHCTAGNQAWTARELQAYFMWPVAEGGRGWSRGGYHWLVEADGRAVNLYSDAVVTNGTAPYTGLGLKMSNRNSVHVCYTGGVGSLMQRHAPTRVVRPQRRGQRLEAGSKLGFSNWLPAQLVVIAPQSQRDADQQHGTPGAHDTGMRTDVGRKARRT